MNWYEPFGLKKMASFWFDFFGEFFLRKKQSIEKKKSWCSSKEEFFFLWNVVRRKNCASGEWRGEDVGRADAGGGCAEMR